MTLPDCGCNEGKKGCTHICQVSGFPQIYKDGTKPENWVKALFISIFSKSLCGDTHIYISDMRQEGKRALEYNNFKLLDRKNVFSISNYRRKLSFLHLPQVFASFLLKFLVGVFTEHFFTVKSIFFCFK